MKERIIWSGQEYEMEWFDTDDFSHLDQTEIKQVYGFLFNDKGEICLVRPTKKRGWRLPGGGPESEDKSWKDTIIREADEEADVEVKKGSLKPIGYFKIIPKSENRENKEHFALRVVGKIIKINKQTEDIAEKLINERSFVKPEDFLKYCPWKESGKIQRDRAVEKIGNLK